MSPWSGFKGDEGNPDPSLQIDDLAGDSELGYEVIFTQLLHKYQPFAKNILVSLIYFINSVSPPELRRPRRLLGPASIDP
jgi:hypothetical protein